MHTSITQACVWWFCIIELVKHVWLGILLIASIRKVCKVCLNDMQLNYCNCKESLMCLNDVQLNYCNCKARISIFIFVDWQTTFYYISWSCPLIHASVPFLAHKCVWLRVSTFWINRYFFIALAVSSCDKVYSQDIRGDEANHNEVHNGNSHFPKQESTTGDFATDGCTVKMWSLLYLLILWIAPLKKW